MLVFQALLDGKGINPFRLPPIVPFVVGVPSDMPAQADSEPYSCDGAEAAKQMRTKQVANDSALSGRRAQAGTNCDRNCVNDIKPLFQLSI